MREPYTILLPCPQLSKLKIYLLRMLLGSISGMMNLKDSYPQQNSNLKFFKVVFYIVTIKRNCYNNILII